MQANPSINPHIQAILRAQDKYPLSQHSYFKNYCTDQDSYKQIKNYRIDQDSPKQIKQKILNIAYYKKKLIMETNSTLDKRNIYNALNTAAEKIQSLINQKNLSETQKENVINETNILCGALDKIKDIEDYVNCCIILAKHDTNTFFGYFGVDRTTKSLDLLINHIPDTKAIVKPEEGVYLDKYLGKCLEELETRRDGRIFADMPVDIQNHILGFLNDKFKDLKLVSRNSHIGINMYETKLGRLQVDSSQLNEPDLLDYFANLNQDCLELTITNLTDMPCNLKNLENFCKVLAKNNNIKTIHLNIRRNQLGDDGATIIAKNLTKLTKLDISRNRISSWGALEIARNLTNLIELDISCSDIGDWAVENIAENLTKLTKLYIADNRIGYQGAQAIAQYLTNLVELDISWNQLGFESFQEIALKLTNLLNLDISSNNIKIKDVYNMAHNLTGRTKVSIKSNDGSYKVPTGKKTIYFFS